MLLTHKRLHHPDAPNVLLHHHVKPIVDLEDAGENRIGSADQKEKTDAKNGNRHQVHHAQACIDVVGHHKTEEQHDRASHSNSGKHLIGLLDVRDVAGHPGDQRSGGELVYVGEREVLNPIKEAFSYIACKTGGSLCGKVAGEHPEQQGYQGTEQQQRPPLEDFVEVACINTPVQQEGHQEGDGDIHDNLKNDEEDGQEGGNQVPFCLFCQVLYHNSVSNW